MELKDVRHALRQLTLVDGWQVCTAAQEVALAAQLDREVGPGHALHGRDSIAVATHGACDNVLFFLPGSESGLAVVHLTWQVPRARGAFPWTEHFHTLDEWEGWMRRDQSLT